MASPTEYYVDPSTGSDTTGDGSSGTPWASIQHALDNITRDTSNGDRINLADTAANTLSAGLSLTTYGTPTDQAPLAIVGWDNGGGTGRGEIDNNGNTLFSSGSNNGIILVSLDIHNGGTGNLVVVNRRCAVVACKLYDADGILLSMDGGRVHGCEISDGGGVGVDSRHLVISHCYIKQGATREFSTGISASGTSGGLHASFNVLNLDGGTTGISYSSDELSAAEIANNTLYYNGSSGTTRGIRLDGTGTVHTITNNIIEGVTSDSAIIIVTGTVALLRGNRFFNNSQNIEVLDNVVIQDDNSTLASSPFTDPANEDFSVDTSVKAGAWPSSFLGSSTNQYLDTGAAQRQEPTGGGGGSGAATAVVGGTIVRG